MKKIRSKITICILLLLTVIKVSAEDNSQVVDKIRVQSYSSIGGGFAKIWLGEISLNPNKNMYILKELCFLTADSLLNRALKKNKTNYSDVWRETKSIKVISDSISFKIIDAFIQTLKDEPASFKDYYGVHKVDTKLLDSIHKVLGIEGDESIVNKAMRLSPNIFKMEMKMQNQDILNVFNISITFVESSDTFNIKSTSKFNYMVPWEINGLEYYNRDISIGLYEILKYKDNYPNKRLLYGRGYLLPNYPEYHAQSALREF